MPCIPATDPAMWRVSMAQRVAGCCFRQARRAAGRPGHWRQAAASTAAGGRAPQQDSQPSSSHQPAQRVAVIGGGFAGLAVSWHLLEAARASSQPMQLQLIDAFGLGAGGSGAAAGLLHPYTPRGKMLWQGLPAFQDALRLLDAAEAAIEAAAAEAEAAACTDGHGRQQRQGSSGEGSVLQTEAGPIRRPLAWRHGMLRPARSAKQARDIAHFLPTDPAAAAATGAEAVWDAGTLAALVPGLQPELLLPAEKAAAEAAAGAAAGNQQQRRRLGKQAAPAAAASPPAIGLMVSEGATIHPASYMRALWLACQLAARQAGASSAAGLVRRPVASLAQLQAELGPFDAIVVAAGAAVGSIAELEGLLPLDLCQGHSLDLRPRAGGSRGENGNGSSAGGEAKDASNGSSVQGSAGSNASVGTGGSYPEGAPSLLGSPYIAAHGGRSLVVGATKRYGLTAAQAFDQLSRPVVTDPSEAASAAEALLPAATQLWPPLASWDVEAVRSGVRALPLRGSDGSIPYAGRLPLGANREGSAGNGDDIVLSSSVLSSSAAAADAASPYTQALPPCWLVGGLGARGLVYHAWLGRLLAAAVLSGSEEGLPAELLRWRGGGGGSGDAS